MVRLARALIRFALRRPVRDDPAWAVYLSHPSTVAYAQRTIRG